MQEDAEVFCGLQNDNTGMADTALLYVGVGNNSVCGGMKAAKTTNVKTVQPLASYIPEETKLLEDYYSAPLVLLVGIEFVYNAEYRPFLTKSTEIA